MPDYKAPLQDIEFLLDEVLAVQENFRRVEGGDHASSDMVSAILAECGKFAENELAPLWAAGDREGCHWEAGEVRTPSGFKDAYRQFVAAGWQSLIHPLAYGGQGMPALLGIIKNELFTEANWAWAMYPGLTEGAIDTIRVHGSEEQRQCYLPKLVSGQWSGTMCLTEPQCGSDLAQVRTKAEPLEDGAYALHGTKMFISAGEHDLSENIVHIVLARLPGAPAGTRGISLFIVPKFKLAPGGELGERNALQCGSIEDKMGIHGNATCVLNFDGARGYLLGPENKGLACMFTYMNIARLGTACQGVSAAELAYQVSLAYAKERRSMRALSGAKEPQQAADRLLVHPDVRRMLLTQKAIAEGGRAMLYHACLYANIYVAGKPGEDRATAEDNLGFFTPILKAFLTELGFEAANEGLQVFGGHGYIREWGVEQIVRDSRIATLYEGTTGIQALDLVGRKVLLDKFRLLDRFGGEIRHFARQFAPWKFHPQRKTLAPMAWTLYKLSWQWKLLGLRIALAARKNPEEVGAASVDFLKFSGYVYMAYMWARMALAAQAKLERGEGDSHYLRGKCRTAEFYFKRLLPRAQSHAAALKAGADSLMTITEEQF